MAFIGRPLGEMTLGDLQVLADQLTTSGLQSRSKHRVLSAIKSLFAFGHRLGYLPLLRLPAARSQHSGRCQYGRYRDAQSVAAYLDKLERLDAGAYERLELIEQPTGRDIAVHPHD